MPRLKNPGVWAFNALLIIGALFCAYLFRNVKAPFLPVPMGAHWLWMVPITAGAELCMFSVRYRSDSQTFSLGEISYVLGAVYLRPLEFLIASALGLSVVYTYRRAPLIRSTFNIAVGSISISTIVGVTRFVATRQPSPRSVRLWASVVIACFLAAALQGFLVALVRSIAARRWLLRDAPKVILFTQLNGIAVSSLGVLVAIVLGVAPALALAGAAPILMSYIFCRQLVNEHTLRTNIEFLYETAQSIHNTADIDTAFRSLLDRSLPTFHASFGAVILRRSDTAQWMSFAVGATANGTTDLKEAPRWIPKGDAAKIISSRSGNSEVRLLKQLGSNNAIVAPLHIENELQGILVITDRGTEGTGFEELDRRLFELLSKQVALGLENSQLERSLGVVSRLEEEMRHQANHDILTGLANRSALTAILHRPSSNDRAVLLIDLDDFKTINDSLGHEAGDNVLIEVAKRLSESVREGDLVARLGGDEFAIVLSCSGDRSSAVDTAKRISSALAPPMTVFGRQIEINASIGVATAGNGVGIDELLRSADVAMYQAKNAGKGRHMLFETGMDEAARERLQIISGLRDAIEKQQISLVYQPIVDLVTGMTVAVEALVRWEHPELGTLSPDKFIPLAEESGLINSLGAWVLRQACVDLREIQSDIGPALELHVNVSPNQMAAPDFVSVVTNALELATLDATRLVVEITEKTALTDSQILTANVAAIRLLGVQLALDDFGTGYSSLAAAHGLPLNLIKIDQLFVRSIEENSDVSLVRAILAMAESLGLLPVAEGIETQQQRETLVSLGCPFGQGYLFSRPLPKVAFKVWQHRHNEDLQLVSETNSNTLSETSS
jgi:diguanylate cyclase (GGDEF)-like protein